MNGPIPLSGGHPISLDCRLAAERATPWKVSDALGTFISGLIGAIFRVEIEMMHTGGKWRKSQNRSADWQGVQAGLQEETGNAELARLGPEGSQITTIGLKRRTHIIHSASR